MFGKRSAPIQSEEEYNRVIEIIRERVLAQEQGKPAPHHYFDEQPIQFTADRIKKLEEEKELLIGQIELFRKIIGDLQPQLDDVVNQLIKLRS